MQAYTRLLPLVVLKRYQLFGGRFVSEVESAVCPHIRYVVRPHWWPVAHSLIPCTHEYTVAHMTGWVLGQNTADPHRPTHSHTHYAHNAYCAPTHTYIQHERRTCPHRAQRAQHTRLDVSPAIASLTSAYVRLRSELTDLLVSCRAGREEARSPPVPHLHYCPRG